MASCAYLPLTWLSSGSRAKAIEESAQQLRNEATQSQQRASSAEVKVEVLQKAVQQAEERVATLEMQVERQLSCQFETDLLLPGQGFETDHLNVEIHDGVQMQSRSGLLEDDPGTGGSQAPAGSREADLANQIKHLREELTSAQETAAAATGHAKQYEMLAKSSDEAVKVMQASHHPSLPRSAFFASSCALANTEVHSI